MRPPSLTLAVALLALAPSLAGAHGMAGGHGRVVLARHGIFRPAPVVRLFIGPSRFAFRRGRALGEWGWGFADGWMAGEGEPVLIPLAASFAPPPPPGDERPTVEATPQGVTIIRGPGSHHLR